MTTSVERLSGRQSRRPIGHPSVWPVLLFNTISHWGSARANVRTPHRADLIVKFTRTPDAAVVEPRKLARMGESVSTDPGINDTNADVFLTLRVTT
jgi:hypothetical protein